MKVAVIGGGSLGTAIAQSISTNVDEIYLYARRRKVIDEIKRNRVNSEYYPAIKLSDKIIPINNFSQMPNLDAIFFCVPSSSTREVARELEGQNVYGDIIISTAKGIEYPSLKRMSQIISEEIELSPVIFSGPTFANEIVLNLPTAATIASKNANDLKILKNILATDNFIVDMCKDEVGTEMCGVIKNINAIAYGICEGMNVNENAKFAMLTKGFNETIEIVTKMGGCPETVHKYCGFGDLILTSTSNRSRNRTMGLLYGQKIIIDEKSTGVVFEGKKSIRAINDICETLDIDNIIVEFVHNVVVLSESPKMAFRRMWEKLRE